MPAISIIIPTFNHRDYVLQTLDSIWAQTFKDYEVIVVNDGSPDDTVEVLRPMVKTNRIRYFEQPNQGQAAARNKGLEEAGGDFIAFLDDDDLWPPDKLKWQINRLREWGSSQFVAVCGGFQRFDGFRPFSLNGSKATEISDIGVEITITDLYAGNPIMSPGQLLIRRTALDQVGGFDASIWGADDYDLYMRLVNVGPLLKVPGISLFYRVHTTNASSDYRRMYRNTSKVRRKYLGRFPTSRRWNSWWQNWAKNRRVYGKALLAGACTHLRNYRLLEASRDLAFSFWLWPSLITSRSLASAVVHSFAHAYKFGTSRFKQKKAF